jgi:hypothetical protein
LSSLDFTAQRETCPGTTFFMLPPCTALPRPTKGGHAANASLRKHQPMR